jgi:hypothetical protein
MRLPGHGKKGSRVKRPILAFLAAVTLSFGVFGTAPARAATPDSMTQATPSPAHDHGHRHHYRDHDGDYEGHHRHHYRDYDGDGDSRDDGHDGHHQRRCAGLIVVCLV